MYWKLISHIPTKEILYHRIVWSFFFFFIFLNSYKFYISKSESINEIKNLSFNSLSRKDYFLLFLSSSMITANWYLYIYAINSGQVLEGSLAYYISPLLSIFFGSIIYKEKLNKYALISIIFCLVGVFILLIHTGRLPFLALSLAITFSIYGLIKKQIKKPVILTSVIESGFFIIPAIFMIFWGPEQTVDFFSWTDWVYLIVGGIVTGLPLILFSFGAQKAPLTTIGFFQYISPSLQFICAVFFFNEAFNQIRLLSFSFIWFGAGLYVFSLYKKPRP